MNKNAVYPYILRNIRESKRWTQVQMAMILNIKPYLYSKIELGYNVIGQQEFNEYIKRVGVVDYEKTIELSKTMLQQFDSDKAQMLTEVKYLGCAYTPKEYGVILSSIKNLL